MSVTSGTKGAGREQAIARCPRRVPRLPARDRRRVRGLVFVRSLLALALVGALAGCAGDASPTGPGAEPSIGPTDVPAASAPAASPGPAGDGLPAAVLVAGATSSPGKLGSWSLDGRGGDSPWIPAAALTPVAVGSADSIAVRYADGAPVGAWTARVAAANDPGGLVTTAVGGRDLALPPLAGVELHGLPVGSWVLQVRLDRSDERGNAIFSWLLEVR
jgi:hypothetical protein